MFNNIFGSAPLLLRRPVTVAVHGAFDRQPFGWAAYRQFNKGGNVFEDIAQSTVSFIQDPIQSISNQFKELDKNVLQPIYREVVQPVGHALEKVGQGIANDPITFVAQVAAIATQQYWALPIIAAASTAAHGGSLEQVLTATAISAATAYVGANASGWILDGLSADLGSQCGFAVAGTPITASTAQTIAQVGTGLSMAAIQATGAGVQGRDPLMAAIPALAGTAAGAAIGQIAGTEAFQQLGSKINEVGSGLGSVVQRALTGVASAALTGVMAGKDTTAAMVSSVAGGLVNGLVSTVDVVSNLFKDDAGNVTKMGAATQNLVTNLASSVATTAFQGGSASDAFTGKVTQSLAATLSTALTSGYNALAEQVSSLYGDTTNAATQYNDAATAQKVAADKFNASADAYNTKLTAYNDVYNKYSQALTDYNGMTAASGATQAQADAKLAEIRNYEADITARQAELDGLRNTITTQNTAYMDADAAAKAAQATYFDKAKALGDKADTLTSQTNQIAQQATQDLAKSLDPNFNADEYKAINNLGTGVDPYTHWLATGKDQGLYTNTAAAQGAVEQQTTRIATEILKAQGYDSVAQVSNEDWNKLLTTVKSTYGNNLYNLENATADNITKFGTGPKALNDYVTKFDPTTDKPAAVSSLNEYGAWNKPTDYTAPEGTQLASKADIVSGKAYAVTDENRNTVWLTSNGENVTTQYDKTTGDLVQKAVEVAPPSSTPASGANVISATSINGMDPALAAKFVSGLTNDEIKSIAQTPEELQQLTLARAGAKILDTATSGQDDYTTKMTNELFKQLVVTSGNNDLLAGLSSAAQLAQTNVTIYGVAGIGQITDALSEGLSFAKQMGFSFADKPTNEQVQQAAADPNNANITLTDPMFGGSIDLAKAQSRSSILDSMMQKAVDAKDANQIRTVQDAMDQNDAVINTLYAMTQSPETARGVYSALMGGGGAGTSGGSTEGDQGLINVNLGFTPVAIVSDKTSNTGLGIEGDNGVLYSLITVDGKTALKNPDNQQIVYLDNTQQQYLQSHIQTTQNIKDAAAAQGVKLTDTQAAAMAGEMTNPNSVTSKEVTDALKAMGISRPTSADVAQFVGNYSQSELTSKLAPYLETARYNSIIEQMDNMATYGTPTPTAIQQLSYQIAQNQQAGMDANAALNKAMADVAGKMGVSTTELTNQITGVQTSLSGQLSVVQQKIMEQMQANQKAGQASTDALNNAINTVAGNLGTTKDQLLTQMGMNQTQLQQQIQGVQSGMQGQLNTVQQQIMAQVNANQAAGMAANDALNKAIQDVAAANKTSAQDILSQLGTTTQALQGQIQASQAASQQYTQQQVSNATQAIQTQMAQYAAQGQSQADALNNAINSVAGQLGTTKDQLLAQLGTTQANLQGQITGIGTQVSGLSGQLTGTQNALTSGISALSQQINANAATAAKTAATNQQKNNFTQMMNMVLGSPDAAGQKVTVSESPAAQIKSIYDWSSIFATPQQAALMPSPYGATNTYGQPAQQVSGIAGLYGQGQKSTSGFASGGMINSDMSVGDGGNFDDLLNLLKGNSG